MEIRRIETGRIPTSITGGTDKPIEKIAPVSSMNNDKKPNPEWQPKNKEPGKGEIIDVKV